MAVTGAPELLIVMGASATQDQVDEVVARLDEVLARLAVLEARLGAGDAGTLNP